MSTNPMHMANAFDGSDLAELDPSTRTLIERRDTVLAPSYRLFYDRPLAVERAEGVWLYDTSGNRYLDAYNNVPAIGHSHPRVLELVSRQLGTLNTHTRYLTSPVVDYSERLLALFPDDLSRVVFACTGSEAVDLALRTARYATGAEGIICTSHAYHGTTAWSAEISPSLGPNNRLGWNVITVPAPDSLREDPAQAALTFAGHVRDAIAEFGRRGIGFAGMIVDSILSSDGVQSHPRGLLAPAVSVVHEAGGLWIADEVQPGFGRLGDTWWGFERHDIEPDLVVLGKPMGNGLPISALIGKPEAMEKFGRDVRYFNTFGGNPVSIAAATAVLDVIESDGLLANAKSSGETLLTGLQRLATTDARIADIRGVGLFIAAEFTSADGSKTPDAATASAVVNGLRSQGVLVSASGPFGNVVKIRPPLPFDLENCEYFLDRLGTVLTELG